MSPMLSVLIDRSMIIQPSLAYVGPRFAWYYSMDGGQWTPASRNQYNLRDGVARCNIQVRKFSWSCSTRSRSQFCTSAKYFAIPRHNFNALLHLLNAGVPQVLVGDLHPARQRRNVEPTVGVLGETVPRAAILSASLHHVDFTEGRIPDS